MSSFTSIRPSIYLNPSLVLLQCQQQHQQQQQPESDDDCVSHIDLPSSTSLLRLYPCAIPFSLPQRLLCLQILVSISLSLTQFAPPPPPPVAGCVVVVAVHACFNSHNQCSSLQTRKRKKENITHETPSHSSFCYSSSSSSFSSSLMRELREL